MTKKKQVNMNDAMLNRAKEIAADQTNMLLQSGYEKAWKDDLGGLKLTPDDFYIVWFCKTLQNWKALLSTDALDQWPHVFGGKYIEITYNGDKGEAYADFYVKLNNKVYEDKKED